MLYCGHSLRTRNQRVPANQRPAAGGEHCPPPANPVPVPGTARHRHRRPPAGFAGRVPSAAARGRPWPPPGSATAERAVTPLAPSPPPLLAGRGLIRRGNNFWLSSMKGSGLAAGTLRPLPPYLSRRRQQGIPKDRRCAREGDEESPPGSLTSRGCCTPSPARQTERDERCPSAPIRLFQHKRLGTPDSTQPSIIFPTCWACTPTAEQVPNNINPFALEAKPW